MTVEPVTATAPRGIDRPILVQQWRELTFLHWAVPAAAVAPLLPPGTRPDTLDGMTYVGLVPFRMYRLGPLSGPGLAYLGTFCETNVRLYSVDEQGRRGVVFRSLEAARLLPVLTARLGFNLPYMWATMRIHRGNGIVRYTTRRRWPGPRPATSELSVRVGPRIEHPSDLEHFLTARWGLHVHAFGRTRYLPNAHPAWALHQARVLSLSDDLVAAAGLPEVAGRPPDSVLYAPGVRVKFGAFR